MGSREFCFGISCNLPELLDQSINNDILRKIAIVTGSDGYETYSVRVRSIRSLSAIKSWLPMQKDGQPLGPDRYPLIVAPGDKKAGRFVFNIVKIEVRDPQA
jgi:hypothetical protein